jgi:hypothetical protein
LTVTRLTVFWSPPWTNHIAIRRKFFGQPTRLLTSSSSKPTRLFPPGQP